MGFRRRSRLRRLGPGRYAVELAEVEREVLADLADQLRDLLAQGTDDPRLRRLFPTAYHEDPDRDLEYQVLARDQLIEGRLASLEVLGGLDGVAELDADGAGLLLRALNDARLVLGTVLDVSEDDEPFDPDEPDAGLRILYHQLTALLGEVVEALADGLGDGPAATASP